MRELKAGSDVVLPADMSAVILKGAGTLRTVPAK
jgi:hypothetical protein